MTAASHELLILGKLCGQMLEKLPAQVKHRDRFNQSEQ